MHTRMSTKLPMSEVAEKGETLLTALRDAFENFGQADPLTYGLTAHRISRFAQTPSDHLPQADVHARRAICTSEVPISTNEGFDYKHLYFIALHDFQVASF